MLETESPSEDTSTRIDTTEAKEVAPVARSRGPGVVTIAGHYPEAVRRQLRIIAAQEGRTSQSLLGEALNDLFRKRGQLPIAPQ